MYPDDVNKDGPGPVSNSCDETGDDDPRPANTGRDVIGNIA